VSLDAFADQAPLDVTKLRELCPALGTAGLEHARASERPRGKILKLKLGFNPNSSSVGTTVVVLLWTLASSGAVLALAASVLAWRFSRPDEPPGPQA
jgi:hypothetical protein